MREHVFEEGHATRESAVVTYAQVLMPVDGLVGVMALRSCDAYCLRW
jgi:hypothetical protein